MHQKLLFIVKRLIKSSACLMLVLASNVVASPVPTTLTGILLDAAWKQKVYDYAKLNIKHSAWGLAHSERDYQVSIALAEQEGVKMDTDIIFAAAFLHDLGAIDAFKKKDMEHSVRSVEIAEPLLQLFGFPMQKWPKVKAAILGHMYYADRPFDVEAVMLHDADVLDFLGTVGIARLISITERHTWAQHFSDAFITLQKFKSDLPNSLITNAARKLALQRITEMDQFFSSFYQETYEGKAL